MVTVAPPLLSSSVGRSVGHFTVLLFLVCTLLLLLLSCGWKASFLVLLEQTLGGV